MATRQETGGRTKLKSAWWWTRQVLPYAGAVLSLYVCLFLLLVSSVAANKMRLLFTRNIAINDPKSYESVVKTNRGAKEILLIGTNSVLSLEGTAPADSIVMLDLEGANLDFV